MTDAARPIPVAPSSQSRPDPQPTLGALLEARAATGGDDPALTFYGEATGERTELGHATLENWVAKAANLLVEELELVPGDVVDVRLPTHWTTVVLLLAAWRVGLVTWLDATARVAAAVVAEDRLDDRGDWPERLLLVGGGPAGRLIRPAGDGLGFAEEVLAFADDVDAPAVSPGDEALRATVAAGDATVVRATHAQLLGAGAAAADAVGLATGGRLLSASPLDTVEGLVCGPLAALVVGASLVLVDDPESAALAERFAAERCTAAVAAGRAGPAAATRVRVRPSTGGPGVTVSGE